MKQDRINEELKNMCLQVGFGALICGGLMTSVYVILLLLTRLTGVY